MSRGWRPPVYGGVRGSGPDWWRVRSASQEGTGVSGGGGRPSMAPSGWSGPDWYTYRRPTGAEADRAGQPAVTSPRAAPALCDGPEADLSC